MNEPLVTLQGWLGADVRLRRAGETPVASFRLACTPRRRRNDEWVDAETQWFTVTAWRGLAVNCDQSLRRGDPVVVHGRLSTRSYVNGHGLEVSDLEVEAAFVGHDLNRGRSEFTKGSPSRAEAPAAATVPGEEAQSEAAA